MASATASTKVKVSGYAKRNNASAAVPLELDSDPDFNPGVYIPEDTKKNKRTKRASHPKLGSSRGKKRQRDSDDDYDVPKARKRYRPDVKGENPLLEFFNDTEELGLHSASEDETDDDEEREDDDDEDQEELDDDAPIILKSMVGFTRKTTPEKPTQPPIEDDSVTESDTDEEDLVPVPPSQIVAAKPMPAVVDDDSVTESDTEDESADSIVPPVASKTSQMKPTYDPNSVTEEDSESVTEEDSDMDDKPMMISPHLKPRPGFPLASGQKPLGPLVLDEAKGIKVPASINTYLREYQRDGKTIQVISFLAAIMRKDGVVTDKHRRRDHVSRLQDGSAWKKHRKLPAADATWPTCLIIAPTSLVLNWARELKTWGYFEVGLYIGNKENRRVVLDDFKKGRLDVVITSFDLARRDIDAIDTLAWTCLFVDEVHRVKNITSKVTQAYHQFTTQRRFGLTGTAIQNGYIELYTLLDWTNPGRIGTPRQWKGFVEKPLLVGQSAKASEEEIAKSMQVAITLRDKIMPRFFLRRTKEIIKDQLPQKIDQVVFCPLSDIQISVYKRILETPAVQNLIHKDDDCSCGSGKKRKDCCVPYEPADVLRYMAILLKLSNHLALILPSPTDSKEQVLRNRQLSEIAFPDGAPMYVEATLNPKYCGKWLTLKLLLGKWRKDPTNKVLIFTKSVKLIEMLEHLLKVRSYTFVKLDGNTKQETRMEYVDQFQNDPDVYIFLISTLAGGTGLNLTKANKVVIFDPNWNPAHDLQAMDRAFRLGQTRDVEVYRLLGGGSLEEQIYGRQLYKQQQMAIGYEASVQTRYFDGVQGDAQRQGELFGIKNIFKLNEGLSTKMTIEKANIAELDWALANMNPEKKRKMSDEQKKLFDAEKSESHKDDGLRGLAALFFDDEAMPVISAKPMTEAEKILAAAGVQYSHRNDHILAPSKIGAVRAKNVLAKTKKRASVKSKPRTSAGRTARKDQQAMERRSSWPPIRHGVHHRTTKLVAPPKTTDRTPGPQQIDEPSTLNPAWTPEETRANRQRALIEIGWLKSPDDMPAFALNLINQPEDARANILRMLDEHAMKYPPDLSSD
ncbi:RAD26-like SNF2 family DNA-dependent ATPase [Desarmillaria tabescens]|uniref:RAD26-like SNF2 family DNA-dependent ATPase n=1 Tax=Armillaria tabescens TaxID=1929756 RepID=A0AA39NCF9_ARMTA|nr:RAD26-like SNF2 family DNA-dependent ATPase [Desarmillaria tabescens]KAK0463087.1 RAD26-like SNF2 family DNA-dependent ATPase [Desarmillaria tabescens]